MSPRRQLCLSRGAWFVAALRPLSSSRSVPRFVCGCADNRWIARIIILALVHLRRVTSILAHKTLHRRPGLDQRPVRVEAVIARPTRLPALIVNRAEKQDRHFPRAPFPSSSQTPSGSSFPPPPPDPETTSTKGSTAIGHGTAARSSRCTEPSVPAPSGVARAESRPGQNANTAPQRADSSAGAPHRRTSRSHAGGAQQESSLQGSAPSKITTAKQVIFSCSSL
jgi:hypothetical protein